MTSLELFIVLLILIIVVIIAILTAIAAQRITGVKDYDKDEDLKNAHSKLTIGSVIAWLSIAIIVLIILYNFRKGPGGKEGGKSTSIKVFMIVVSVLIFIEGILASIASVDMDKSKNSELPGTGARSLSNTVAVLGIIGGVLGVTFVILSFVMGGKKDKKKDKKEGEEEDTESEEEEKDDTKSKEKDE